jgi:tRNA(fMet)-specific endonuclease VapC
MYLLDTNTCIQFLNGASILVEAQFRAHSPDQLKLCSIVKAEMLYRAARSVHGTQQRVP